MFTNPSNCEHNRQCEFASGETLREPALAWAVPVAKTLFMETTEVPASRTAAEVSAELIKAGATQIATDYKDGKVTGLRWTMMVNGQNALFEMPARVFPIYKLLRERKGIKITWEPGFKPKDPALWEKAERVAWRQLLRWVQAQNAMIECGMVQPMEVFTAYWIPPGQERTLFQTMMEQQFKMLPAPEAKQ